MRVWHRYTPPSKGLCRVCFHSSASSIPVCSAFSPPFPFCSSTPCSAAVSSTSAVCSSPLRVHYALVVALVFRGPGSRLFLAPGRASGFGLGPHALRSLGVVQGLPPVDPVTTLAGAGTTACGVLPVLLGCGVGTPYTFPVGLVGATPRSRVLLSWPGRVGRPPGCVLVRLTVALAVFVLGCAFAPPPPPAPGPGCPVCGFPAAVSPSRWALGLCFVPSSLLFYSPGGVLLFLCFPFCALFCAPPLACAFLWFRPRVPLASALFTSLPLFVCFPLFFLCTFPLVLAFCGAPALGARGLGAARFVAPWLLFSVFLSAPPSSSAFVWFRRPPGGLLFFLCFPFSAFLCAPPLARAFVWFRPLVPWALVLVGGFFSAPTPPLRFCCFSLLPPPPPTPLLLLALLPPPPPASRCLGPPPPQARAFP